MTRPLFTALILLLWLVTSCSTGPVTGGENPAVAAQLTQTAASLEQITPTDVSLEPDSLEAPPDQVGESLAGTDCLGDMENPIAQTIADEYSFTTYVEVMTWFCNGAEFEDILTALQTEEMVVEKSGAEAGEMLQMLADGFTWDEIWQVIGLTE